MNGKNFYFKKLAYFQIKKLLGLLYTYSPWRLHWGSVCRKKSGKKAMLWGALMQSIPDIDFYCGCVVTSI